MGHTFSRALPVVGVAAAVLAVIAFAAVGTGVIHLTPQPASMAQPCVQGSALVPTLFGDDTTTQIRVSTPDMKTQRVLRTEPASRLPAMFESLLSVSGDSSRLAYVTADDERMDNARLTYVDVAHPETPHVIATLAAGLLPIRPVWSPTGDQLAFVISRSDQGRVTYHTLAASTSGGPILAPVALDAMMRQRPIVGVPVAMLLAVALLIGGAYAVYGKGTNPIQTALRWTGAVYNQPSPVPSTPQTAAPQDAGQPAANHPASPVVNGPESSPSASPTAATPSSTPSSHPTASPIAFPSVIHVVPPPIYVVCVTLTSVTLTDSVVGSSHTLTWKGNGTCNPFSGSITATYSGCSFTCLNRVTGTRTIPVSAVSGTYPDQLSYPFTSVSYKLTLTDGRGATATATAT